MNERPFTRPQVSTPQDQENWVDSDGEPLWRRYGNSNHNSNRVTVSDRTKGFVVSTLVALNLLATVAMFAQWRIAERETRMLEYYLLELDAKFIKAGLKDPSDAISKHLREERVK